ncbi:hypothetical protein [Shinella zoogloeoides]|uniref:hypothetical protein n=1 Tax=Shinella zoogloeoides TaxID=352475 RepID=UPI000E65C33D|nr:hypothetical protein [Shinella zoogloeoides]
MSMEPKATETGATKRSAASRALRFVVRLPFVIVVAMVAATLHAAWYIAFAVLSALRPVVNVMILGGMVMLLLAFAAFVKPEASPGMPPWAILLMAIGSIAFAMGYSRFVDWITPPGETDPAERYRRTDP